ncbi:MAG: alpha/beta fold hydrolase, partial [Vicinamibacterales bacterium]
MRALEPVRHGFAVNPLDNVRVHFEVFGAGDAQQAVVFSPAGAYIHGRIWKEQVSWFVQRGFQVVTWDGRGSGRSDRPASGYSSAHFAGDLLAVMDATGIERAALIGITCAIRWMSRVAVEHPERVTHLISVSSFPSRFDPGEQAAVMEWFLADADPDEPLDWRAFHMRNDYHALNEKMARDDFPEPHSTRQIEDFVAWTMEASPEALVASCLELSEPVPTAFYQRI